MLTNIPNDPTILKIRNTLTNEAAYNFSVAAFLSTLLFSDIAFHLSLLACLFVLTFSKGNANVPVLNKLVSLLLFQWAVILLFRTLTSDPIDNQQIEHSIRIALLALFPILSAKRQFNLQSNTILVGSFIGLFLGVIVAYGDTEILGLARAKGERHPIMFANTGLFLFVTSIAGVLHSNYPRYTKYSAFSSAFAFTAFIIITSGSRGPLVSFLFLTVSIICVKGIQSTHISTAVKMLIASLTAVIVIALLTVIFFFTNIGSTTLADYQYILQGIAKGSAGTRFEMWKAAIDVWLQHPIWGAGEDLRIAWAEGAKFINYDPIVTNWSHAHNEILNTLAKRGLIGLSSLLLIFGIPLLLKLKGADSKAVISTTLLSLAWFVSGLTQTLTSHMVGITTLATLFAVLPFTISSRSSDTLSFNKSQKIAIACLFAIAASYLVALNQSQYVLKNYTFKSGDIDGVQVTIVNNTILLEIDCELLTSSSQFFMHFNDGTKNIGADVQIINSQLEPIAGSDKCALVRKVKGLKDMQSVYVGQQQANKHEWARNISLK